MIIILRQSLPENKESVSKKNLSRYESQDLIFIHVDCANKNKIKQKVSRLQTQVYLESSLRHHSLQLALCRNNCKTVLKENGDQNRPNF